MSPKPRNFAEDVRPASEGAAIALEALAGHLARHARSIRGCVSDLRPAG